MRHNFGAQFRHVRIRPLAKKDIELLRKWRNDKKISSYLAPIPEITEKMQLSWYYKYLEDSQNMTFAIEEINELNRVVGSVALYDFKENTAEVGKIVVGDPDAAGKKIGYYALLLAMYIGYQKMGIETFLGEVHEDNMSAKTNDLRAGFIVRGKRPFVKGGYELVMDLPKEHFWEVHDFLDEIEIFEVESNE